MIYFSSFVEPDRSLEAVEAIVAKYLSPKSNEKPKTKKRLIKRPYGVSVTDLDVISENIIEKQKKKEPAPAKKKAANSAAKKPSERRSKEAQALPTSSTNTSSPDPAQISCPTDNSPPQSLYSNPMQSLYSSNNSTSYSHYHHPNGFRMSPSLHHTHPVVKPFPVNIIPTRFNKCTMSYHRLRSIVVVVIK